jgi:hypothetical protein
VLFAQPYLEIFSQVVDPSKVLNLSDSVRHFEAMSGHKLLMDGPTDPPIEFLGIVNIFSLHGRVLLCPTLIPPGN